MKIVFIVILITFGQASFLKTMTEDKGTVSPLVALQEIDNDDWDDLIQKDMTLMGNVFENTDQGYERTEVESSQPVYYYKDHVHNP